MTKEPADFATLLNNGDAKANGIHELLKKVTIRILNMSDANFYIIIFIVHWTK